jgi:hypothetical protein
MIIALSSSGLQTAPGEVASFASMSAAVVDPLEGAELDLVLVRALAVSGSSLFGRFVGPREGDQLASRPIVAAGRVAALGRKTYPAC